MSLALELYQSYLNHDFTLNGLKHEAMRFLFEAWKRDKQGLRELLHMQTDGTHFNGLINDLVGMVDLIESEAEDVLQFASEDRMARLVYRLTDIGVLAQYFPGWMAMVIWVSEGCNRDKSLRTAAIGIRFMESAALGIEVAHLLTAAPE